MRYLVLGAGVGKAIAEFLSKAKSTDRLILADSNFARAYEACLAINKMKHHALCTPMNCDVEELKIAFLSKFDVIVSALPAKYNYNLAEKAIDARVNFCDLGGVVNITERMLDGLNERAQKNYVSIVPDCGVMPGLGIMLARIFVEDLNKVDTARIYVGGIPQKPRPPLYYQGVFNIHGVESICYDMAPVLENHQIVEKQPFSDPENFTVSDLVSFSPDGLGTVEAFITAGASVAHNTFHGLGVGNFCEKTVRWPGFVDYVSPIPRCDFLKKVGDVINIPVDSNNPDLLWMKVAVSGENKSGKETKTITLLDFYDKETGLTAMERCTGFPTALIAKYLARHDAEIGVRTPENAFSVTQLRQMREELKKRLNLSANCKTA